MLGFAVGATLLSYMSVYTLDASDEELVNHDYVSTILFKDEESPIQSEELQDKIIEEQWTEVRAFNCTLVNLHYKQLIMSFNYSYTPRRNLPQEPYRTITV